MNAVLPIFSVILPLSSISDPGPLVQYGMWVYLLVFIVITFASTIVGGIVPDNTFLFLTGAVALSNGLSIVWLFVIAVGGGFAGYEINYWGGRFFGIAVSRKISPRAFQNKNVRNALNLMDRFGLVAMILSRFMPILNLPSFIAGVNVMEYRRFFGFNLISSVIWVGIFLMLGYYIGSISIINDYLNYIMDFFFVVFAIAIIIIIVLFVRDYLKRKGSFLPEQRFEWTA